MRAWAAGLAGVMRLDRWLLMQVAAASIRRAGSSIGI